MITAKEIQDIQQNAILLESNKFADNIGEAIKKRISNQCSITAFSTRVPVHLSKAVKNLLECGGFTVNVAESDKDDENSDDWFNITWDKKS